MTKPAPPPGATTQTKLFREGQLQWEGGGEAHTPVVEEGSSAQFADISKHKVARAAACIYCGGTHGLSREHIIPYALGGTTTIPNGSCETCRKKTHAFETDVLRGPMKMVRFVQGMPSGTDHEDAPRTVSFKVVKRDGTEEDLTVATKAGPVFLPFPQFDPPKYLAPGADQRLKLIGTATASWGAGHEDFMRANGARSLTYQVDRNKPVAFARMVAKIAYCFAWSDDQLRHLQNPSDLPRTFLDDPDNIGKFVGGSDEPLTRYQGLQHRLEVAVNLDNRIMFMRVQLFAAAGTPTYIVVLGTLKDGYSLT